MRAAQFFTVFAALAVFPAAIITARFAITTELVRLDTIAAERALRPHTTAVVLQGSQDGEHWSQVCSSATAVPFYRVRVLQTPAVVK